MSWFTSLMLAASSVAAAGIVPSGHAEHDLYIRFERAGYRGNVYLNTGGGYVILQTGPSGVTETFTGMWMPHGSSGFCIRPKDSDGKCFQQMPQRLDETMSVTSSLDEVYVVTLKKGR